MTHRTLAFLSTISGLVLVMSVPAASQPGRNSFEVPMTSDGRPDLGGVRDVRTVTPLERPAQLGNKTYFTDEEAAGFATDQVRERNVDLNRATTTAARRAVNGTRESVDLAATYNKCWYDRGTTVVTTRRTFLVIDPPDGRIPARTQAARTRASERVNLSQRITQGREDRSLGERCIVRPNAGPPMTPAGYNNNGQIFQTADFVAILTEQIHDARIVPLDQTPYLPQDLRQWMGDSRGRWEGDTLVVETTKFNGQKDFQGAAAEMHLVERFRRADADPLLYEFTVTDPDSFVRQWTAQIPMRRSLDAIYEYACHEGNYGMEGTLSGARAIERAARN